MLPRVVKQFLVFEGRKGIFASKSETGESQFSQQQSCLGVLK